MGCFCSKIHHPIPMTILLPSWPYLLSHSSSMESLSVILSFSPPPQNHLKTQRPLPSPPISLPQTTTTTTTTPAISTSQQPNTSHTQFSSTKKDPHSPNFLPRPTHFPHKLPKAQRTFLLTELMAATAFTLPSLASESAVSVPEQVSDKINLESILVSIDDFFNGNPFFVAGCTFVWLVVIPLVQAYLRKYKFVLIIDAFWKLRDDPNAQLLDIRDEKSLGYLKSPNLKILNKCTVQVPFLEEDEAGFVKRGLERSGNPAKTVVCVLGK